MLLKNIYVHLGVTVSMLTVEDVGITDSAMSILTVDKVGVIDGVMSILTLEKVGVTDSVMSNTYCRRGRCHR